MTINFQPGEGATFIDEVPQRLRKFELLLDGTTVGGYQGQWGILLHQHVIIGNYVYHELYMDAVKDTVINFSSTLSQPLLIIILTGNIKLSYPEGSLLLSAGRVHLVSFPTAVNYSISLCKDQKCQTIIIQPDPALLEILAGYHCRLKELLSADRHLQLLPYSLYNKTIKSEINKMKSCTLTGQMWQIYQENRLSDLLITYMKLTSSSQRLYQRQIEIHRHQISQLIERIDASPHENINVEEQANLMGITQRALQHGFKEQVGETVPHYVINRRILKAQELLMQTNDPISTVSLEVGYTDPAFFNRVFKSLSGVTPGRYRSDNKSSD